MTALPLLLLCFPVLGGVMMSPDALCAGLQEGCPLSCCLMCLALYITLQHEHADFCCFPPICSCASCIQHKLCWCSHSLRLAIITHLIPCQLQPYVYVDTYI